MTAPLSLVALDRELRLICGRPNMSAWADGRGWHVSIVDNDRDERMVLGIGDGESLADAVTAAVMDFREQLARQQVEALRERNASLDCYEMGGEV